MGTLVTQTWSFAGHPERPNYSNVLVEPFINYNIKHGWAVSTAPGSGDQLMSLQVAYYT